MRESKRSRADHLMGQSHGRLWGPAVPCWCGRGREGHPARARIRSLRDPRPLAACLRCARSQETGLSRFLLAGASWPNFPSVCTQDMRAKNVVTHGSGRQSCARLPLFTLSATWPPLNTSSPLLYSRAIPAGALGYWMLPYLLK